MSGNKVRNSEVELKANDCIGIGVMDDAEPNLKHPIYKLIYAPLPRVASIFKEPLGIEETQVVVDGDLTRENSNILQEVKRDESKCCSLSTSAAETSSSSLLPGGKSVPTASSKRLDITSNKRDNFLTNIGKSNENLNLNSSTLLPKEPILYCGDVIVLSDDEEDNSSCVKSKEEGGENIFNKPNPVLSNTGSSNKLTATSSGTITNNESFIRPTNEKAVIHEPISTVAKRELVHSRCENVKVIFGDTDEVILQSVKAINPLVFKKLNDDKAIDKPLCSGDTIDLLSDNEENEDKDAQNVECFGKLVSTDAKEAHKTTNTNIERNNIEEVKQADNSKCKTAIKSPNLFDNSLNSSKNSVYEQRSVNFDEENVEKAAEDSVNTAEELAAFVDMDDDMLFSQILRNDIKSEMMFDSNEEELAVEDDLAYDAFKDSCSDDFTNIEIKKKNHNSKVDSTKNKTKINEIENDVWITIDDDDEYYDEEFEHKVSDWSTKLLSQKMNMSQVGFRWNL